MSDLLKLLERNIVSRQLLVPTQALLVAVSGGVDSMVLLRLLHQLSLKHQWELTVAHLNHQLRGQSSDADEKFVRRECQRIKVPVFTRRADVHKAARGHKLSIEMAARQLRHQFLARTAARLRIRTIVLAHHADDQLEHFFLRLFRGSGSEGLAGMKWRGPSPADRTIDLVRPMLDLPKSSITDYAAKNEVRYREDSSNRRLEIPRNQIRQKLLPLLRADFQPALDRTVLRAMDIIGSEAEFISQVAEEWLRKSNLGAKHPLLAGLSRSTFGELPIAVQRRCIQLQLRDLGLTSDFELVEQLRWAKVPIPVSSPGSAGARCVFRNNEGLLAFRTAVASDFNEKHQKIEIDAQSGEACFDGIRINWRTCAEKGSEFEAIAGQEIFDLERVGSSITLRHWRPGDRFQPVGMAQPIKLQDLFVNTKLPRSRRHTLVIAVAGSGEIFWVEGLRISERFKLTKKTIRRLQWQWQRP